MKIFFSKNNNFFYYFFERNVGIEPTPRTGMFVFCLLNLFRKLYRQWDLNPHGHHWPKDFRTTIVFTTNSLRAQVCSLGVSGQPQAYLMTPTLLNCCLWSGLSLNHIEFCARLMYIVIDGCFLLLRVPIFHHKDYYFPTSMSVHTHLSFNLGSLRKVSTHCLTNVTVPYIFNAYLRTTFRITLARDCHIYISTI